MAIDTIKSTAVLDGAIATADIADANITTAKIADANITTAKIADDAVTADKLANSINTSIAVGASALPKAGGTMTGTIADFRSTGIDDNSNALAMTIDANENVGIGVTPETDWHSSIDALQLGAGASIYGDTTATGNQISSNARATAGSSLSGYKYIATDKASTYQQYDGAHNFRVAPSGTADAAITWTDAIKIDNDGRTNVGTGNNLGDTTLTVESNTGGSVRGPNPLAVSNTRGSASTDYSIIFYRAGNIVGSVQTSLSATSFVTSSDYRLKENVTPISGATAQTKLLKPCNFDWIVGGNVNGFIAHELAEVVPEAVTGTKDAMMDEEYEVTPATDTEAAVMGIRSVPDMQGIDQSKLVPLLVKTIQELEARITALEDA